MAGTMPSANLSISSPPCLRVTRCRISLTAKAILSTQRETPYPRAATTPASRRGFVAFRQRLWPRLRVSLRSPSRTSGVAQGALGAPRAHRAEMSAIEGGALRLSQALSNRQHGAVDKADSQVRVGPKQINRALVVAG